MITYKHGPFIAQAIESVLMQKTDYPIELVIGEDRSPDHTRDVCQRYADQHPDIIRLLPPEPNMGSQKNFIRTLYSCRGQYIALLEGDDFWTDAYKLQKQVELLEQNPELVLSFHNVNILENDKVTGKVYPGPRKETINAEDVFKHDYYQTCSILFRSAPLFAIDRDEAHEWIYNDITLFSLLLSDGSKGRYLPETMATYRVHPGGVWSMADASKRYRISRIAEDIILDKYYPNPRLRPLIAQRETLYYELFMVESAKCRDLPLMLRTMAKFAQWSLRTNPLRLWKLLFPPVHLVRATLLNHRPVPKNVIVHKTEKGQKRQSPIL